MAFRDKRKDSLRWLTSVSLGESQLYFFFGDSLYCRFDIERRTYHAESLMLRNYMSI
jgi:hypothetical protein